MSEKILFVDDDPNILSAYQRQLHKQFTIDTALGGNFGLEAIDARGPFAVIVSDMRMPGMDGIQFLSKVREKAPDSVRMMLTGNADQQTAIDAVNEGNIFRFLTKPCLPDIITKALTAGIEQYRLITAEKELLEKTLHGCIKVLTDVLTLVNPTAFGRASRVQRLVQAISAELKVEKPWQIEIAAMLSQLGCITISEDILTKLYSSINLNEQELQTFHAHPQIGSSLISSIPRLENVAEIIAYQEKHFDGSGIPCNSKSGADIPMGARILNLALDFDSLVTSGMNNAQAYTVIQERQKWYDQNIVVALKKVLTTEKGYEIKFVKAHELTKNMTLAEDIKTSSGKILLTKGHEIAPLARIRLINLAQTKEICEPIKVFVPVNPAKDAEVELMKH
ncbi:MAG TPA: HD domain-containing phosphohydrolase [Candidatus Wunengus sp. YC60]|uniref:HD domain-containing phosphohydrolase n=1 Tax=Candidatus Wunengus sp. YC60 TaxID=3367697 RepID=UPI00402503CA